MITPLQSTTFKSLPKDPACGSKKYLKTNKAIVNATNEATNGLFAELDEIEQQYYDFLKEVKDNKLNIKLNRHNLIIFNSQVKIMEEHVQLLHSRALNPNGENHDQLESKYIESIRKMFKILLDKNSDNATIKDLEIESDDNYMHVSSFKALTSSYTKETNSDTISVDYFQLRIYLDPIISLILIIQDHLRELYLLYIRRIEQHAFKIYFSNIEKLVHKVIILLHNIFVDYVKAK